ncbi:MAG: ribokinase [Rhodobacteraceae bacterium]|nr:ribokinase [Paracoccaceae bacterium]
MVRIAAFGDNNVDCYLADGRMYPGGNCFNLAVYARRYGALSAFLGAVAEDAAGSLMRRTLSAEGVETERLRVVPGITAYCFIAHRGGERIFLDHDLGVSRFVPAAADLDYLAGFDAVHVGQSSGLDDWVAAVARGTRLSYDFAVRRDPWHRARLAPLCWLAAFSAGDLDRAGAIGLVADARARGAVWALATRGAAGALILGPGGLVEVAARPIVPVDTLGAGDSFIARTLVGLLRGEAPEAALAAAAAAAAETCGWFGAVGHGEPIDVPARPPASPQAP